MKARIKVYRQLLRQCQMIVAGKDFEAALVAAEEARSYLTRINDLEKQGKQPELFNVADTEGAQRAAEE